MKQRMLKLVRFVSFTIQLHLHLIYNTTQSDNVYKRHAAFGKRYELLITSIAVMKKHKLKNH